VASNRRSCAGSAAESCPRHRLPRRHPTRFTYATRATKPATFPPSVRLRCDSGVGPHASAIAHFGDLLQLQLIRCAVSFVFVLQPGGCGRTRARQAAPAMLATTSAQRAFAFLQRCLSPCNHSAVVRCAKQCALRPRCAGRCNRPEIHRVDALTQKLTQNLGQL
jgi:hypothetical protein